MGIKGRTRRSAAKRFQVAASGRIKYRHAGKSHILTKKGKDRKRHLRGLATVDITNRKAVRGMIPGTKVS